VSADANNQVTFQERVTDEDGDSLTLLSFELDTIDGVTQSGGARSPGWLNFGVQKNTLNDGSSELLLDVALDQSGLQADTDYEFKAVVDDGTVTVPHTVKFCIGGVLQSAATIYGAVTDDLRGLDKDLNIKVSIDGSTGDSIDVADNGDIYVYDSSFGIRRFDKNGGVLNTIDSYETSTGNFQRVQICKIIPNGDVLLPGPDASEQFALYSPDLNTLRWKTTPSSGFPPVTDLIVVNNTIYIGGKGGDTMIVDEQAGTITNTSIGQSSHIATDGEFIYRVNDNPFSDEIKKVDPTTESEVASGTTFNNENADGFDVSANSVYASSNGRISKYSKSDLSLVWANTNDFAGNRVAVDESESLLVTISDDLDFKKFDSSDGTLLDSFTAPGVSQQQSTEIVLSTFDYNA
jgi:hypothetical protein